MQEPLELQGYQEIIDYRQIIRNRNYKAWLVSGMKGWSRQALQMASIALRPCLRAVKE